MQKYLKLLFLGLIIQFSLANTDLDLGELHPALQELANNISSKIQSATDLEKPFAEKCKKHGGQEAYEKALAAKEKAGECVNDLVNFDQLQREIEEAKPTGDLDSVFKKYCRKSPQFKGCISNFTTAFQPCLEENEKSSITTVLNVTEQLAEFICYKEGDRIALFIAEGGPECLNASNEAIRGCVETVFKKNFSNTENIAMSEIPLLLFNSEQCEDFFKLQTCVVSQLEKCKEPTPANIVDSLFNFVKKVTPCSSFKFVENSADVSQPRSNSPVAHSFVTSILTILFSVSLLSLIGNH